MLTSLTTKETSLGLPSTLKSWILHSFTILNMFYCLRVFPGHTKTFVAVTKSVAVKGVSCIQNNIVVDIYSNFGESVNLP